MSPSSGVSLPSRIHICGGPSAGKTTLARELGERLHLPVYSLDSLIAVDQGWDRVPLPKRVELVEKIVDGPRWITEGVQLGWTDPLLQASDLIIWLDAALPTLAWRHIRRHRRAGAKRLLELLRFQIGYFLRWWPAPEQGEVRSTRIGTSRRLAGHLGKTLRFSDTPSVGVVLSRFEPVGEAM